MADTKVSALTAVGTVAGAQEIPCNDAGASKKLTVTQVSDFSTTRIASSSGAAGSYQTLQYLTANAASNATTSFVTVMTTTGVGIGLWKYEYFVIGQTTVNTVALKFQVGHSGTTTKFFTHELFINDVSTASSVIMASTSVAAAGVTGTHYFVNGSNGVLGVPTSTVSANTDIFIFLRGMFEVTVSGSLALGHASEVATATTVRAGTNLQLIKIA